MNEIQYSAKKDFQFLTQHLKTGHQKKGELKKSSDHALTQDLVDCLVDLPQTFRTQLVVPPVMYTLLIHWMFEVCHYQT